MIYHLVLVEYYSHHVIMLLRAK